MNNTTENIILPFTADELIEEFYEVEVDTGSDDVVREDYSGRGMYGATCFGVVVASYELLQVGVAIERLLSRHNSDDDTIKLLKSASTDSMGMSTIVYFRGFELAK